MKENNLAAHFDEWQKSLLLPGKPNEWESKILLEKAGVPAQTGILLKPGESFEEKCKNRGCALRYPVVVKVCSGEILHKTEVGGISLNVSEEELPDEIGRIQSKFPEAPLSICEMVRYKGSEIILGAVYDESFGPAVMVGAGGILTELYNDAAFRLAPCSLAEAGRMLRELTIFPVFNGYRGMETTWEPLAAVIERVSLLAAMLIQPGCQLDINPIVWTGSTWLALDAMIVLDAKKGSGFQT